MEIKLKMPTDIHGFVGRECPVCKKYFKIKFGTGLKNPAPCHCPYCNHIAPHDQFWTIEQINYAKSVASNYVSNELLKTLKKSEVKSKPNQLISFEIKVKGRPTSIDYYSERDLEQYVCCKNCTLEYAIYGKFSYCPDCGIHNSHEIFITNIELFKKLFLLCQNSEPAISKLIIEDALENSISVFDGSCRNTLKLKDSSHNISFQNIYNVRNKLIKKYGFDIALGINKKDWDKIILAFQKRHLLAHNLGVVDQEYINKTNSDSRLLGKEVSITQEEVIEISNFLKKMAENLSKFVS
jgi:Zn ribbon nucleic-acid-binding protein